MNFEIERIKIVPVIILLLVIGVFIYWFNPSLFSTTPCGEAAPFEGLKGKVNHYCEQKFMKSEDKSRWVPDEVYKLNTCYFFDQSGQIKRKEYRGSDDKIVGEPKTIKFKNCEMHIKEDFGTEIVKWSTPTIKETLNYNNEGVLTFEMLDFYHEGLIIRKELNYFNQKKKGVALYTFIREYVYDSKDELVNYNETHVQEKTVTSWIREYTQYDSQGNWKECLEYKNDTKDGPTRLLTRKIEYSKS